MDSSIWLLHLICFSVFDLSCFYISQHALIWSFWNLKDCGISLWDSQSVPAICGLNTSIKKLNIEHPVFIRLDCRIFQVMSGKPNSNSFREVGLKTVIVTINHQVSLLVSNSFLWFKFLKSVVGIIGVFYMWSLLVLTQQPWGPSGSDWRPETDVAARSCVFMCACLVLLPAWNTCVCRKSVCTAVYLT